MQFASLRKNLENDIRVSRQHRATNRARQNMQLFDTNKKIYDNYYYHLLDHDTGNTYVLVADYQNMRQASRENAGQAGIIYKDPNNLQRSIIRTYDGSDTPRGASSVYLTRDEECIYINGVRFYIETLGRGEQQTLPTKKGSVSGRDFYEELEQRRSVNGLTLFTAISSCRRPTRRRWTSSSRTCSRRLPTPGRIWRNWKTDC